MSELPPSVTHEPHSPGHSNGDHAPMVFIRSQTVTIQGQAPDTPPATTQRRRRWSRGRVSTPGVRLPYQVQRRTTAVSYRLLVGWNGSSLGQLDPSRLAEAEGFEPPVGFPTVAFKAT